jgi:hypothetical protein
MIAVRILRMGLTPMGRRRVAVAMGLALVVALKRVGKFGRVEIRAWRGVPDVAHVGGEKVDAEVGRRVDVNVVDSIARDFGRRKWDGVTVELSGELGGVELGVDIDIYASEYVPVRAGIVDEGVDVLAEPRGHVGGRVVESFYGLFEVEEMKAVVEELVAEMCYTELRIATYAGVKTHPLWRLAAEIYAMRNYGFAPEDAAPLWYRPWIKQMAKELYRLAPPGLRELAGLRGMRRAVEGAAPELLKRLRRHYYVKTHEDALQLVPLSAEAHRGAVAELRDAVTWAMKVAAGREAQKIIEERGYLDWHEYVEALKEELMRRLA